MRHSTVGALINAILLTAAIGRGFGGDAKDEAIKKDHQILEGRWNVTALVVDGTAAKDEDARKLMVVNGVDGSWTLSSEGKEVSQGTSVIDPAAKFKTIDFTIAAGEGKGNRHLGVYELGEHTRKLCFASPGAARPTELTSTAGSQRILITFQREKEDAIKRDRKRIEGTWLVTSLEMSGIKAGDNDANKLAVVFGADGSWNATVDGMEVSQGNTSIDPLKSPRTIDFTPTTGNDKGKESQAIYEFGEATLKICALPAGKGRPTEFTSTQGNEQILLTLQRMK